VSTSVDAYTARMPNPWAATVAEHRRDLHEAILDATVRLVAEHGLRAVTMAQVAATAGIGRATLYKYYSGIEAILLAWHEREIGAHLRQLEALIARSETADERLRAVLETFARMTFAYRSNPLVPLLHRGDHVARARSHLTGLIEGVLADGQEAGDVRSDTRPEELSVYVLHALGAAAEAPNEDALTRLVDVILAGIHA
jgi:AcrR family transcriptional regulator